MAEKIIASPITVISAIFPEKPSLWNLDDGHGPDFWTNSQNQHVSEKMKFLRDMVGYSQLDDEKQLARAAALCQAHVLDQFPIFKALVQDPNLSGVKCMALVHNLGDNIEIVPLPPGVYKPLPGFLEHEVKHCATVEEVLTLNEKLMAINEALQSRKEEELAINETLTSQEG
jgi:hypothetical protein